MGTGLLVLLGVLAFAALWLFGLLWGVHIVPGWSRGRLRKSGGWMVGSLIFLTASGYLLYYLTDDQSRSVASLLHWSAGLALPALFAVHRVARRRRGSATGDADTNDTPLSPSRRTTIARNPRT